MQTCQCFFLIVRELFQKVRPDLFQHVHSFARLVIDAACKRQVEQIPVAGVAADNEHFKKLLPSVPVFRRFVLYARIPSVEEKAGALSQFFFSAGEHRKGSTVTRH